MEQQAYSTTLVREIANFKNKTSEKTTNEQTQFMNIKGSNFYLQIYPNYSGELTKTSQTVISLKQSLDKSVAVNVIFKISLINENGDECFTNESLASFVSTKSEATKGGWYLINRDYILNEANRLLPGGKLTIKCEVTLVSNEKSLSSVHFQKLSIQEKTLENYKSLLENDKHSDVVCVIGKKEFKLHKNILAAQSPVFKAMFDSDLEESKQNRVDISDIQVEVFEELVRFIYTANYESIDQYALDLFVAADMYQLDTLKEICAQTLGSNLTMDSVVKIFLLAGMHNSDELKSKCIDYISKNCTEVVQTGGWKAMMKNEKNFVLLDKLYQGLAVRAKPLFK